MKEHVSDLLSSFVDGRLAESDRSMVESHLERCEACGTELKDLKNLTAMLAASPRQALPTGFQQRLERKRRDQENAEIVQPKYLLPKWARYPAYAMSAAVVCLVAFDAIKQPALMQLGSPMGAAQGFDASDKIWVDGRAKAAGPRQYLSMKSDSADSAAPAAAEEGRPQERKRELAPGAPLGVADLAEAEKKSLAAAAPAAAAVRGDQGVTNEQLQKHLDAERRKLGIAQIMPKGAAMAREPENDLPPMSPAEARDYMQGMTDGFTRQRMAMENHAEPVPLGGGRKPQLLKPEQGKAEGAPLIARNEDAANARNVPSSLPGDLQASAGMAQAPVTSLRYGGAGKAKTNRSAVGLSGALGGAGGIGSSKDEAYDVAAAAETPARQDQLTEMKRAEAARKESDTAASSMKAAPAKPASVAPRPAAPAPHRARSTEELKGLWSALGKAGELPAVDFASEMVVAVSGPSPVEIVKVTVSRGRLVLTYRPGPPGGPLSALRVVPRADLPLALESAP